MRAAKNSKSKVKPAGKVLIAGQDSRVAGLIQQYLLKTGFEAVCEMNVDAALETLTRVPIDLLIVDGEMPEKVLRDFVEAVARIKPGIPTIAVGISEHETQSRTLSGFIHAFIEKPFSISEISNTIKVVQTQMPIDSFGLRN